MTAVVVLLHAVGFGVLVLLVAPAHLSLGGEHPVYTVGVGLLAYTFGLRHAFDADHVAAIDNTTRVLVGRRQEDAAAGRASRPDAERQPLSVGFWFSLGHSTIVFVLAFLLTLGLRAVGAAVVDDGSTLHTVTGLVGSLVSGSFLWLLGLVNLVALVGLWRVFTGLRHGHFDEAELERRLEQRGLINRLVGGLTRGVRRPWHIYPVGVLFGLGFDTASEVGLLVLAGGAAAFALPFWAVLVLPVLFAAGMCLADTVDGVLMNAAYGWAWSHPVRKVFYNLAVTSLSVAVSLVVGTVELAGALDDAAGITSGPLAWLGGVPLADAGYAVVALFGATWLAALALWRFGRVEERWTAGLSRP
ncbi:HoxN/HupN/NixA family nickel/cobalt transporter [Nocardioides sp. GY 10127]|uniref:HoxN/HupN/NixA family nickel/cobalt transporter n=1 Tax=Nocardioides sp. GY 10127 TaxID=2569762 RepID=UPI0010A8CB44|nr:HoxN/HupN/NixA family nickel/cobalt transporter [Nocardioides sp. GY 10127]TIC85700.1 HoxN/HupN/NixA family nickel/cobalt transporter [Nocardioides sp. GY 10127]